MEPVALAKVLEQLVPLVAIVVSLGIPAVIVWTVKHHKYRMRELDLEALRIPANDRLRQVEARLAAVEQALGVPAPQPQRSSLQDRAALLEGPPVGDATGADPARLRQR